MGTKLYKPRRKKRKEKLYLIDKLEIGGIVIASAAIIAWSGWSVAESLKPAPVIKTYEVDTDTISEYLSNIDSNAADTDEASKEVETESAADSTTNDKEEEKSKSSDKLNNEKTAETIDSKDSEKKDDTQNTKAEDKKEKSTKKPESKSKEQIKQETATVTPVEKKEVATQPEPSTVSVYVAKEALNVRKDPDPTVGNVIASYKAGEIINVTESHGGWYKVNKDGVEGYIAKTFVEVK